jgi:hypothetical protein
LTGDLAADMVARIRANTQDLEAWSTLFLLLAAAEDHPGIEKLVTTRQQVLGDGLGFFYYVMRDLLAMGRDSVALAVLGPIGATNILLPVAHYMRGLIASRHERSDEAVAAIREAARLAAHPAVQGFAARDRLFLDYAAQHIAAQAGFLLTAAEVTALAPPSLVPAVEWHGDKAIPGAAVLVAACDPGYFTRFAPGLIASVAESGADKQGLHIHLVAPDAETLATIPALLARYPFLRVSTETGARDTPYYACSRFLVAPELFARYRRPLVAIDVDAEVKQPVGAALAALGPADLGWFEMREGVPVPSLKCSACLVALADTAGSRRFLELYGRYVALMLARGARWMVDQAGLWCLSRSRIGGFAVVDLTAKFGPGFGGIVLPADAKDEKRALRNATR